DHLIADLRTVSVGEDDLVAGGIEIDHALQAALEIGVVLLDRALFAGTGNRVASEGDHGAAAMGLNRHGLSPARKSNGHACPSKPSSLSVAGPDLRSVARTI